MSERVQLVSSYLRWRKIAMALNQRLAETIGKDVLDEAGRKLGILQGKTLVLGSEDELVILMDYCIYDIYRRGRNAVQRMLAEAPPSDPEELALLESQARA